MNIIEKYEEKIKGQLSGFDNVDGFDGANVVAEYNIEDGQQTLIDNGEDVMC